MTPKIVDKDQRKGEIAHAALGLFAKNGFESTSISQIAEAAGIGKGTVYEYFESKEELIAAALAGWIDHMNEAAGQRFAEIDDPAEHLRAYSHVIMETFMSGESVIQLWLSAFHLLFGEERAAFAKLDLASRMVEGPRETLAGLLLDGVSRGHFRPEIAKDAQKIAVNVLAYLDGIAMHYWLSKSGFDLREQIDQYINGLIDGLRPQEAK